MKKAKRFQSGNLVTQGYTGGPRVSYDPEAEKLKKEGLEASKDDRVGFFKRLAMGNIDDPKSEAYKRYGAGRGTAERTKVLPPAPAIRSTDSGMGVPGLGAPMMPKEPEARVPSSVPSSMPSSMPPGLRSAIEGAGVGEGGTAPKVMEKETTTVKTPRKTVTQTKKAVAKPTYSEKEAAEDLARETKRAPKAPKTSELRAVTRAKTRAGTPVKSDDSGNLGALGMGLGAAGLGLAGLRKRLMRPDVGGSAERSRAASAGKNPRIMGIDLSQEDEMMRFADEGNPNYKKGGKTKAKSVKKYASGGMVGKASKRADGIAKKGKTKGRIC